METYQRKKLEKMMEKLKSLSKDSDEYKSQLLEIRVVVEGFGYEVLTEPEIKEDVASRLDVEEECIPDMSEWTDFFESIDDFVVGKDKNLIALDDNEDKDTLYVYDSYGAYTELQDLAMVTLRSKLINDYERLN